MNDEHAFVAAVNNFKSALSNVFLGIAQGVQPEVELFMTHTPHETFKEGRRYVRDGVEYEMTRLEKLVPTSLVNGGVASCWSIKGKKVVR